MNELYLTSIKVRRQSEVDMEAIKSVQDLAKKDSKCYLVLECSEVDVQLLKSIAAMSLGGLLDSKNIILGFKNAGKED